MSRRVKSRPDNQRAAVANEAARIIQEQGLKNFRLAKEKAVERLSLRSAGPLPSNSEIETALAARNRIFRHDDHATHIRALRIAALNVMELLVTFDARLVGPALSGNATEHSTIDLHVFNDYPEAIGAHLDTLGIRHRSAEFHHQFRLRQRESFPGFRFRQHEFEFATTVFSERQRRHSPLSPITGQPMQRASRRDVEALLD